MRRPPAHLRLCASATLLAFAVLALISTACFDPKYPAEPFFNCGLGGGCPSGYTCSVPQASPVQGVCKAKGGFTLFPDGGLFDIPPVTGDLPPGNDGGPEPDSGECSPPNAACASCKNAQVLPEPPMQPSQIQLMGTTHGTGGFLGSCPAKAGAEATSPEQVYVLTLPFPATVAADTMGTNFDTIVYLRSSCEIGTGDLACSDDTMDFLGPVPQSSITSQLDAGTYYLFVDGFTRADQGDFILNLSVTP